METNTSDGPYCSHPYDFQSHLESAFLQAVRDFTKELSGEEDAEPAPPAAGFHFASDNCDEIAPSANFQKFSPAQLDPAKVPPEQCRSEIASSRDGIRLPTNPHPHLADMTKADSRAPAVSTSEVTPGITMTAEKSYETDLPQAGHETSQTSAVEVVSKFSAYKDIFNQVFNESNPTDSVIGPQQEIPSIRIEHLPEDSPQEHFDSSFYSDGEISFIALPGEKKEKEQEKDQDEEENNLLSLSVTSETFDRKLKKYLGLISRNRASTSDAETSDSESMVPFKIDESCRMKEFAGAAKSVSSNDGGTELPESDHDSAISNTLDMSEGQFTDIDAESLEEDDDITEKPGKEDLSEREDKSFVDNDTLSVISQASLVLDEAFDFLPELQSSSSEIIPESHYPEYCVAVVSSNGDSMKCCEEHETQLPADPVVEPSQLPGASVVEPTQQTADPVVEPTQLPGASVVEPSQLPGAPVVEPTPGNSSAVEYMNPSHWESEVQDKREIRWSITSESEDFSVADVVTPELTPDTNRERLLSRTLEYQDFTDILLDGSGLERRSLTQEEDGPGPEVEDYMVKVEDIILHHPRGLQNYMQETENPVSSTGCLRSIQRRIGGCFSCRRRKN